jgi:hypothetical protein
MLTAAACFGTVQYGITGHGFAHFRQSRAALVGRTSQCFSYSTITLASGSAQCVHGSNTHCSVYGERVHQRAPVPFACRGSSMSTRDCRTAIKSATARKRAVNPRPE